MTGERCGFSRVAAGLSSYDGEFRLPLVLPQGSPIFHLTCEGKMEIAVESLQAKRYLIKARPGPNVPLQGPQGSQGCIPDSPGELGLVSRGRKRLRSPLESGRVSLGTH